MYCPSASPLNANPPTLPLVSVIVDGEVVVAGPVVVDAAARPPTVTVTPPRPDGEFPSRTMPLIVPVPELSLPSAFV